MTFRPSIHGWPFGHIEGVDAHVLGLGAQPTAEPPLGGGLCWAALDRYLRGVRIPPGTRAPEAGDPLHSELIRRQVASFSGVWGRVREWQGRPDGSWRDGLPVRVPGGRNLASLTRAEWRSTRSRLNGGEPVLLMLLLPVDPYRRPRGARQVLATRWKLEDARIVVSVYDPERPGDDDVELSFGRAGPLDARLSDGSEVRGFMAIPYDRVAPAPLRAETFGDRSVLGLNRKVRGRVAAATGRRRIDLVARSAEGALLHFSRLHGNSWEGANVTDREEFGSYELYSDPVAVRSMGLHVFARNYVGDLLHFRLGRQWSVANRTDHKRAGARFRLVSDPVPVPGHRGRISVVGLDKDGGLVHYTGHPLLGWSAEQVAGDPLSGDPVAAWDGSTLHVAGTARDGRVLHWEWDGESWSAADLSTAPGVSAFTVAGRIALRVIDGALHIAGRSKEHKAVVYRKALDTTWSAIPLESRLAGDPVLTGGPAGPHLFAPLEGGGVLHAWSAGAWLEERLLDSRSSLPAVPRPSRLAGWGSAEELRLWGRADGDLWMLIWRPDSDWVLERLSDRSGVAERHRPGDDPTVVEDATGLPHLFFTDGRGTVLHLEPSNWEEPGIEAESGAAPAVRPEERSAPKSAPALVARPPQPEAPAARSVPPVPEPAQAAPEATKPEEAPSELPGDLPYLDFEADPAPRPPVRAEPSLASAAGEADRSAPEESTGGASEGAEGSAKESAPAPIESEPLPPPPGLPGLDRRGEDAGPGGGEPEKEDASNAPADAPADTPEDAPADAAAGKDFRWGGGSPARGSAPIEPMDLDLLDSWPTAPPSLRKRDKKEQGSDRKSS